MNDTTLLYIVLFIARCVIATIFCIKWGWKAFGMMMLYTILTVATPEMPI